MRGDAELAAILRRFLANPENEVGTNGLSTDAALDLRGVVALRNEDEYQAVWEARG